MASTISNHEKSNNYKLSYNMDITMKTPYALLVGQARILCSATGTAAPAPKNEGPPNQHLSN